MTEATLALLWLQPEPSRPMTDAVQFTVIVLVSLLVIVIAMYYVFKILRPKLDRGPSEDLRSEFEQSKEALLAAAQAKKAAREADEGALRRTEAEEKEKELLKENVDPQLVIGKTCPLCGLEMMADQELVIDPHTGQGYHFSSFLNDWPRGQERPKYLYRYPQDLVLETKDLIGGY